MRAHDVALVAQIEELIETEVTELPAVDATIIALRAHAELQPQVVRAKGHGRLRPVKVVDKDGVVIKTGTTAELMQGLLRQQGVLDAVVEGERPKFIYCERCRARVSVPVTGQIPKRCRGNHCPDLPTHCSAGCGRKLGTGPSDCLKRGNGKTLCQPCAVAAATALIPPAQRRASAMKTWRSRKANSPPRTKYCDVCNKEFLPPSNHFGRTKQCSVECLHQKQSQSMSARRKGQKLSEETKRKVSEGMKRVRAERAAREASAAEPAPKKKRAK